MFEERIIELISNPRPCRLHETVRTVDVILGGQEPATVVGQPDKGTVFYKNAYACFNNVRVSNGRQSMTRTRDILIAAKETARSMVFTKRTRDKKKNSFATPSNRIRLSVIIAFE